MKNIILTLKNFGPYKDERIDFTKLGDNELFLISGPTGSGKTMILDGISYALYGKASGENREDNDFVSDYFGLDDLTEVFMEFEIKDKKYSIRRVPKQERKKKSGEGTTIQNSIAELQEIGKDKKLYSRIETVNEKINELIGLNHKQFIQIMMMPQGEFRKFLVADSKDKEDILKKLFNTHIYSRLQKYSLDEERKMKLDLTSQLELLRHDVSNNEYINHKEMKAILNETKDNYQVIFPKMHELIKKDSETVKDFEKEKKSIEKNIKEQVIKIEKAKKINEKLDKKQKLKNDLKQELKKDKDIKDKAKKAKLARKSLEIKPLEEYYIKSKKELEELKTSLKEIKEELIKVVKDYELLKEKSKEYESKEYEKNIDKLKESIKELNKVLPQIDEKEKLEKILDSEKKEIKSLEETIEKWEKELVENKKKIKNFFKEIKDISDVRLKYKESSDRKEELGLYYKRLDNIEKNKKKKEELKKNTEKLEKDKQILIIKIQKVEKNLSDYKKRYFSNIGAILAEQLKVGQPCPVCSSIVHEKKATFKGDKVAEEDIDKLEKIIKDYENKQKEVEKEEVQNKEKIKSLREKIQKDYESINLKNEFKNKKKVIELGIKKKEEIEKLKKELDKKKKAKNSYEKTSDLSEKKEEKLKILNSKFQNKLKFRIEHRTKLDAINKNVKEGITVEKIEKLIEKYKKGLEEKEKNKKNTIEKLDKIKGKKIETEQKLKNITKQIEKQKKNLKENKEAFKNSLNLKGFKEYKEYKKSILNIEEIEKLEAEVEAYNDFIKFINKNIDELETETKNMKKIQVEGLEKDLKRENTRRDEIIAKTNSLETKFNKNKKRLVDYENRYKKIEKLEEEFGLYSFLTSLLNGRGKNGTDRLTIERYVQIKYFEDIISAANIRLKGMTDERYTFARTKEYSGNKQIGLELNVHDTHTGKQRSVRTLSGGESFKAALALTLGLSDVVQSDSGGIDLGTIFIDEGFGSLDPESLEDAVNCLIDTKEKGKTVGIISHVEGLKERVNKILKVIPTDTSSTTQFISK